MIRVKSTAHLSGNWKGKRREKVRIQKLKKRFQPVPKTVTASSLLDSLWKLLPEFSINIWHHGLSAYVLCFCDCFRDRRKSALLGCYEDSHDDDVTQVSTAFSLVSSFSFTLLCTSLVAMPALYLFGFVMKPDINLFFPASSSLCWGNPSSLGNIPQLVVCITRKIE